MAFHISDQHTNTLDENSINDSYATYLHKFIKGCGDAIADNSQEDRTIMSYDEFKEFFILKALGRSSEFVVNMARDYQYLSFDNFSQITA